MSMEWVKWQRAFNVHHNVIIAALCNSFNFLSDSFLRRRSAGVVMCLSCLHTKSPCNANQYAQSRFLVPRRHPKSLFHPFFTPFLDAGARAGDAPLLTTRICEGSSCTDITNEWT